MVDEQRCLIHVQGLEEIDGMYTALVFPMKPTETGRGASGRVMDRLSQTGRFAQFVLKSLFGLQFQEKSGNCCHSSNFKERRKHHEQGKFN